MRHPPFRRGFTLVELLVVVAIILLIAALSIPAFGSLFKGQGIAKAARVAQTAVMQARGRATTVGRQQMLVFKNDYGGGGVAGAGRAVILVFDAGEDLDGDGNPWTTGANWESDLNTIQDNQSVGTLKLPANFKWTGGKVGGNFLGALSVEVLPTILCMPDGTMRVYQSDALPAAWTPLMDADSDAFNLDTSRKDNYDLAVESKSGDAIYYLNFLKAAGRVRIKPGP